MRIQVRRRPKRKVVRSLIRPATGLKTSATNAPKPVTMPNALAGVITGDRGEAEGQQQLERYEDTNVEPCLGDEEGSNEAAERGTDRIGRCHATQPSGDNIHGTVTQVGSDFQKR
ncbi:hypothetical protein [Salinispora arenicola]|uniref:hypothetical protein n=1 Tax=Salinispora arenicola TaxID=168697 RepID=UPI0034678C42